MDTTIVLGPRGSAAVTQRLAWSAGEGGMGGFRYGGELFVPRWRLESCRAELPDGERVPLAVGDRGDFAVAVLPGGRRFVGVAVFQLSFDCDLAATGQYRALETPDGRSVALIDWSPLAWDQALESRVVRIVLPRRVGGERLDSAELASLSAVAARLESPGGERASLEWRGEAAPDGGYLLCCLIRETPAPALSAPRLHLSIPMAWLEPHPAARWH